MVDRQIIFDFMYQAATSGEAFYAKAALKHSETGSRGFSPDPINMTKFNEIAQNNVYSDFELLLDLPGEKL
jgi:hypothetical protein